MYMHAVCVCGCLSLSMYGRVWSKVCSCVYNCTYKKFLTLFFFFQYYITSKRRRLYVGCSIDSIIRLKLRASSSTQFSIHIVF